MSFKIPRIDKIKWADDQVGGPALFQSAESVSPDGATAHLFFGVSHVRPVVTPHPMHALKCYPQYSGTPFEYTRPFLQSSSPFGSWEPDKYYGKPGTIITQPKAVIVNFQQDGGFPAMPFNPVLVDAIDLIAADYYDRGVHIYMMDFPWGDSQFLTRGIPHGGVVPDYYGGALVDSSMGYLSPAGYSSGDLLFINIAANPIGFTDAGINTDSGYDFGTNTLRCGRIGCVPGASIATPYPSGYFGFQNAFDIGTSTWVQTTTESSASLANDAGYYQSFHNARDGYDRFRHILHVADSPSITKIYGADALEPTPGLPGGYPGSTQACFTAATASLDGFVLGSDIDCFGTTGELAAIIAADIEDFYPS